MDGQHRIEPAPDGGVRFFLPPAERELSRKSFVKSGGAMIVGFSVLGSAVAGKADAATTPADGKTAGPPDQAWPIP